MLVTRKGCCLALSIAGLWLGHFGEFPSSSLGGATSGKLGPKIYLMDESPKPQNIFSMLTLAFGVMWTWVWKRIAMWYHAICVERKFFGLYFCFVLVSFCICVLAAARLIPQKWGRMEDINTKYIFSNNIPHSFFPFYVAPKSIEHQGCLNFSFKGTLRCFWWSLAYL